MGKLNSSKIMIVISALSIVVIIFALGWTMHVKVNSKSETGFEAVWEAVGGKGWRESLKEGHASLEIQSGRIEILLPTVSDLASSYRETIKAEIDFREEGALIEAETENLDLNKYLMYVSESSPVTQEYIDENIELIDVVNDRGQNKKVERRAWYFFRLLKKHLEEEESIIVDLDYGYRSLQDQQDIIDEMTAEHGAAYAWYYAAAPGTSEHHTGLAIDVCLVVDGVVIDENEAMNAETEIFGRIHRVLSDYGFILDYPYENWHFRFVGSPEIAKAYYSSGMSWASFSSWYIRNN